MVTVRRRSVDGTEMVLLFAIMTIEWKDPNMKLHGKRHKGDSYYFRWHYGKQRVVQMVKEYVDKPTERQTSAREAFAELRREVARQLQNAELRSAWMRKFEADNEGYKMLHTYVYAKLKKSPLQLPLQGERCLVAENGATETIKSTTTSMRRGNALVSTSGEQQRCMKGVSTNRVNIETRYMAARGVQPIIVVYEGIIMPLFLRGEIPKDSTYQKREKIPKPEVAY